MTEARSNIEAFFGELDAEGEQEAKAGEHEDSFLGADPSLYCHSAQLPIPPRITPPSC
jgi:hypothetical protein